MGLERFDYYSTNKTHEDLKVRTLGGDPAFDERFMVTHKYENDTANIYLVDMLTGSTMRVTNMPAGVKALFPHFRSDNWFYFLVKDTTADPAEEYMVASDLAVLLGANAP